MGRPQRGRDPHPEGARRGDLSASFSPDGARIVTANGDDTAKVWDAQSSTLVLTLKGTHLGHHSARLDPDGEHIVTGNMDATAKVWDTADGAKIVTLKGHTGVVRSASFNPDCTRIAAASEDETAKSRCARRRRDPHAQRAHVYRDSSRRTFA